MKESVFGDKVLACFAIIFNFWTGKFLKVSLYPDLPMRWANSAWLTYQGTQPERLDPSMVTCVLSQ